MKALLFIIGWLFPVVVLLLSLHIRAMIRRHNKEVGGIIDDAITARDRLTEARREIANYQRVQTADSGMIERLLKSLDAGKQEEIRMARLLTEYRNLSGIALKTMISGTTGCAYDPGKMYSLHTTLISLNNLENKPDAGKSGNRTTGA